jgi:hypothetical protein
MTVLVTVNRYVAVCHPYDATDTYYIKQQARRQVLLVASFSILFNFSRFFEYEVKSGSMIPLEATWLMDDPYYKVCCRFHVS